MSAVVLWRHAPTDDNESERLQGLRDTPVNAEGLAKAQWSAARIARTFGPDIAVYSSPLRRALATAESLCVEVGRVGDLTVEPAAIQRSYGAWEGLTWDEIAAREPEQFARHRAGLDPRIEGWETQASVAARFADAVERVWDPQRTSVIVSHGGPIGMGIHRLLGLSGHPPLVASLPHAAWAVMRRSRGGSWQLDSFGAGAD